jgi:hypothetical protein
MKNPYEKLIAYQRGLFARLEEFFRRATGQTVSEFATIDNFRIVIRKQAHIIAPRGEDAYRWAHEEFSKFYREQGPEIFRLAQGLCGFKLVLGGGSRFLESQLNAVSSSLLYADTIIVPDPVLPWLESERQEERFRHVLFLQAVFGVLHLKPLVDADLPYPAVVVVPTWEKTLQGKDLQTQNAVWQLEADVLAHFVDPGIKSIQDALEMAKQRPDALVKAVERHSLFIAPGGSVGETLSASFRRYEKEMQTWRTKDWLKQYQKLPTGIKLMNIILERIEPQYFLLENAEEFHSHPLLALEQQAHYYKLVSQTNSARLARLGFLNGKTQNLIDGFGSQRLKWLSKVPIAALVELRKNNENAAFRKRLENVVGKMHDSTVGDVEKVATEISHELTSAITDHDQEVVKIQKKYSRIHGKTAVASWAALGSLLIPSLVPFLGTAAPFVLAAKYTSNKLDERAEKRGHAKSLLGVLATVKNDAV